MPAWTDRLVLASLLAACGEETALEPAALGEVCGEHGPFRVLPLDPGVVMHAPPRAVGDHMLFTVGAYGLQSVEFLAPAPRDLRTWSTGPCGESPTLLGDIYNYAFTRERWPDLLLAPRDDGREIVVLDPRGVDEPHVLFAALGDSEALWSELGVISFDEREDGTSAVLLHPYPDDPRGETVTGIVVYASLEPTAQRQMVGDTLWSLTTDGAVIRISLTTGERSLVLAPAREFWLTPDGDHVLWQHATDLGGASDYAYGQLFLHSLADGSDTYVADGGFHAFNLLPLNFFTEEGLVQINVGSDLNGPIGVYTPASGDLIVLPEDRRLYRVLGDGRWLIGSPIDGAIELLDPRDRAVAPLFTGEIQSMRDDGVDVLAVTPCCRDFDAHYAATGPLYRAAFDGSPPRRLADEFWRVGFTMADQRRLAGADIDEDGLARLVLFDPETGTTLGIDERTYPYSARASAAYGDDVVVYSVDDGERSGVWLARVD